VEAALGGRQAGVEAGPETGKPAWRSIRGRRPHRWSRAGAQSVSVMIQSYPWCRDRDGRGTQECVWVHRVAARDAGPGSRMPSVREHRRQQARGRI